MADGHFSDVEFLRRELASLILEWAGKAVKDDPDGAMSTALTRAVGEAARDAVSEQHQVLTDEAADRIVEALERRREASGHFLTRTPFWSFGLMGIGAAALLAVGFLLGQQAGRADDGAPAAVPAAAAAVAAPVVPLAPPVEEPARTSSAPRTPAPQPTARPQRATSSPAAPASRPPPPELGRPAAASGGETAAPPSTQPVGADPPAPTGTRTP